MTNAFSLKNIVYQYGNHTALSLDNLFIRSDKKTALIGPNGSGKSTLLNLLAFLDTPGRGEILFFGKPVYKKNLAEFRKRIGFLPQKPYLLKGSITDNIGLALKFRGCKAADISKKTSAALERLNIGAIAEKQSHQLSGGERQKAALARVLAIDPEVLIMDEPFSHLDQDSTSMLEEFISSYKQPLIFSTHNRLQGQALAHDVISLINGKQIETPLVNLFHGKIHNHCFITGNLKIALPDNIECGTHIAIDPREIVLSRNQLESSMRNLYPSRIIAITEEMGHVRITVNAGEKFHALITYHALQELNLKLGDGIWIHFKSNAVTVF